LDGVGDGVGLGDAEDFFLSPDDALGDALGDADVDEEPEALDDADALAEPDALGEADGDALEDARGLTVVAEGTWRKAMALTETSPMLFPEGSG
jgi:hypothetical protein